MPAMRKFNNAVKRDVLLVPAGRAVRARSLFDFGVGRAGDLNKWVEMGLERVVGVDATADPEAYARLADARAPRLRAIFLPIDASWPLSDPATFDRLDEASGDREVARALWGLGAPSDPRLRAYHLFAAPGTFDVASAMFMVHYLFDEEARLRGFCANVARVLRPGGVFVGCCMDGARVRALLGSPPRPREGRDGDALDWRITPRWGAAPGGPYGHRIDVYVRSIGREVPEYLVDMGTLTREMAAAGMHPLAREAALGMGMPRGVSTGLFLDLPSFARAGMQSHEAEYASLARWFAFAKST
jgi:mRNA (guanine-N7-)-methyltransferase